jgi:hypothetical protein
MPRSYTVDRENDTVDQSGEPMPVHVIVGHTQRRSISQQTETLPSPATNPPAAAT